MRKYFFLLLMVVFTSLTIGQTNDKSSTKLFEYPQNWGKYKTYKERLNALQIPQSQINKIVSDELLEICMNFPYVANLGCYYDLQLGLSNIERMFNGFRELNSRQDYSEVLIRKYRQLPFEISILKSATPIEIGAFSCKTMLLESMIIHAMNSSIFSNVQIDDIMYMAQKLLELKQELPAYFGSRSLATTKNVQSKCIDYLSEKSSNLDDNQLDAHLRDYNSDYTPAIIYTPNNSLVPESFYINLPNPYTSNDTQYYKYYYKCLFGADLISPPSNKYNCHGYAWHMTEGGDTVWIGLSTDYNNIEDVIAAENIYWTDGSYLEISESDASTINNIAHVKVAYSESINHSAIRESNGRFISKWGAGPLMSHERDSTIYGPDTNVRYYTRLSFVGPTIPGSSSVYYIANLLDSLSVTWSLPGFNDLLTANQPSANQCTINNSSHQHIKKTLTANIYNSNNVLLNTLTKQINTAEGFSATYSQTKLPDLTYISGTLYDEGLIVCGQGSTLSITSSDFYGATFTFNTYTLPPITPIPLGERGTDGLNSANPSYTLSGNTLQVTYTMSVSDQVSTVKCVKGDKVILFNIHALSPYNSEPDPDPIIDMMASSNGNSTVSVSLVLKLRDGQNNGVEDYQLPNEWNLTVFDAQTGKIVYNGHVTGSSATIDISDWQPGIYILRANVGKTVIVQKLKLP